MLCKVLKLVAFKMFFLITSTSSSQVSEGSRAAENNITTGRPERKRQNHNIFSKKIKIFDILLPKLPSIS